MGFLLKLFSEAAAAGRCRMKMSQVGPVLGQEVFLPQTKHLDGMSRQIISQGRSLFSLHFLSKPIDILRLTTVHKMRVLQTVGEEKLALIGESF